jgi:N6-L-threonylcarbamoyladenine synthase
MLVLGIDTSCDETAASVVEDGRKVLSNAVLSSLELHKRFGGVVPEIACRAHLESINYVTRFSLDQAGVELKDLDLVAVTYGPGLVGALLVGISGAKSFCFAYDIPLIGVNHLEAHLESNFINSKRPSSPFIGLVVSGGHTSLVYNNRSYKLLGRTRDDAAGEAFDKVAKILGLGYPGGPIIEDLSRNGDPQKIRFPRCFLKNDSLDFSFSGIKTAVLYYVRDHLVPGSLFLVPGKKARRGIFKNQRSVIKKARARRLKTSNENVGAKSKEQGAKIADIAASFQEAIVDTLIAKTLLACKLKRSNKIVIGGGVAANSRFREKLTAQADELGIETCWPPKEFCTDNAAMIASLGYRLYKKGERSNLGLTAVPNLEFGG